MKELADGSRAVAFLNRGENPLNMTATWSELKLQTNKAFDVRDLWSHENLGPYKNQFESIVPGHAVVMVKILENDMTMK